MTEYTTQLDDLDALRKQWERNLQFGVLMADLEPAPVEGERARITLSCPWGTVEVQLAGEIVEASGAHAVVELAPFTQDALRALLSAGLEEVMDELQEAEPPAEEAPPADPVAHSAASVADSPAPAPTAENPDESAGPVTKSIRFSPGASDGSESTGSPARQPVSQQPISQRPEAPVRPSVAQEPEAAAAAPQPTGDPNDLATIAASDGPASLTSEALLPAATQHGDFAKISWREVLLHFFERRSTGVLAIEGFRESRWCFIVDGQPVHYVGDSPHAGEFLSEVLIAEGTISSATWVEALRAQRVTGVPAGEYLVATDQLDRAKLNAALSSRASRITRKLMGMNFGTFRFHPYKELIGVFPFDPVPVLEVVLNEQREAMAALDDDGLIQRAEEFYPLHARPVVARLELLKQLALTPDERRIVLEVLPANWTLGELISLQEMDEPTTLRLMLALKELSLVEFVRDEGSGKQRNRAEREIYGALRALDRRTDFEAFGAHWSSSEQEIKAGHRALVEKYDAGNYQGVMDDRIAALIDRLEEGANAIWERLSSPEGRRAVRRRIVGADQVRMAADLLHRQAEMARMKSNFRIVKTCCERVIDLNPEGSEGKDTLARMRKWLADPRVAAAEVLSSSELIDLQQELDRVG